MSVKSKIKNVAKKAVAFVKYAPRRHKTVYLIGLPEHGNLGDHAITMAERAYMHRLFPTHKIICVAQKYFAVGRHWLRRSDTRDNIFLLSGGGNMGVLYPREESERQWALQNIKQAKIVIFPQSVDFEENTPEAEAARAIYESAPRMKMFARERHSYEKMQRLFPHAASGLVPDIVLSLDPEMPVYERQGVVVCTRHDIEVNRESGELIERLVTGFEAKGKRITHTDTDKAEFRAPVAKQEKYVRAMWELFAHAELVITDRLHGMVFAAITGTPCIAVNNSTGKVGNLYHTWLEGSGIVFASDPSTIEDIVDHPPTSVSLDRERLLTQFAELDTYLMNM